MRSFFSSVFNFLAAIPDIITPSFIEARADPERYGIDKFVNEEVVPNLKREDRLLDAGAGPFRYRRELSKAQYESSDFADAFAGDSRGKHTYTCDITDIPVPDNTFDVVFNAQVIEHVPDPEKAIIEMTRVLKEGGTLYLTAPQISPVHAAPYNFFFFTRYGLQLMFEKAGLEIIYIRPRGGIFWVLGKTLNVISPYIYYQQAFTGHKRHVNFKPEFRMRLRSFLLFPIYIVSKLIIGYWIPFIFFYLDRLDWQKEFTLGYACVCRKPLSKKTN